jgi:chromosomal replication initiation ATPase DnaA
MDANAWQQILTELRAALAAEDFRRWFGATAYASDSGDQITVWVPTESVRRHILAEYHRELRRAVSAIDRPDTHVRFVVAGFGEDDEDDDEGDRA